MITFVHSPSICSSNCVKKKSDIIQERGNYSNVFFHFSWFYHLNAHVNYCTLKTYLVLMRLGQVLTRQSEMFLSVRSSIVSPVASARWRGGKPPAPIGQMGIMVSFFLVLHWQEGEGFLWFHSGLSKMLLTTGETAGYSHSDVLLLQGILNVGGWRNTHMRRSNQSPLRCNMYAST